MNICVFCSASDIGPGYTEAAREFARLLAEDGHALVWGGSDTGLMKVLASGVQDGGGRVIGVSVEFLAHKARVGAHEMIIAPDLPERKRLLLERADAVALLVGGLGTLDEVTEILELKKHGKHKKPVVVLNTDGFYDGLQDQLTRMDMEGFLPLSLQQLVHFSKTPQEALAYLKDVDQVGQHGTAT